MPFDGDDWYAASLVLVSASIIGILAIPDSDIAWRIRWPSSYWLGLIFICFTIAYFGILHEKKPPKAIVLPIYGTDRLGRIDGSGQHRFDTQGELPPFKRLTEYAQKSMVLLVWVPEKIIGQNHRQIKKACERGLKVTVFLMAHDHPDVLNGEGVFGEVDLPRRAETVLKTLCGVRRRLGTKADNLTVRTYHRKLSESPESIIIVDRERGVNAAWAQASPWLFGHDSDSRPSRSAFEFEDRTFFGECLQELKRIEEDAGTTTFECA
jgi:hypothetical protein